MLSHLISLSRANLLMLLRDRLLQAVLGVAAVMLLLVPSLSTFSMRQVQELAITLSLSSISLVLLVLALLLGSSAVWRDIERRYTASILALPVSRAT
ncbi:MAG: ABC transporter permease, partial [Geobacteraceae bacterium]